ncbi:hypothetical protein ACROYT_G008676 [Oculina patagonica]
MAQMWANKCMWGHGFLQFGEYPYPVTFEGQLGQNLARQTATALPNPVDRVEKWYNETDYYRFSKYTSPMSSAVCTKEPCEHYTQLVWAKSKYVGCAVNVCSNFVPTGYGLMDGKYVACDYAPSGNVHDQYPYKKGTACTKCASGKGFCYKGLCKCPLKCQHGGTLDLQNCVCSCPSGWRGMDCSAEECAPGYYGEECENRCFDSIGKEKCEWRVANGHDCKQVYMKIDCAATCGYCDDGSKTPTTPAPVTAAPTRLPVTAAPTQRPPVTATTPVTGTNNNNLVSPTVCPTPPVVYPTPAVPQVCSADQHSSCEGWAAVGECEKNALWMIPNCCVSCKYHRAPKDCIDTSPKCPLWAYNGECEENRAWMSNNCRKSCNVCDVYDRHNECPAWTALGECKKSNWTWMADHCPRSCDVPFKDRLNRPALDCDLHHTAWSDEKYCYSPLDGMPVHHREPTSIL